MCRLSWNLGASSSWNPQGLSRPVMGLLYSVPYYACDSVTTLVTLWFAQYHSKCWPKLFFSEKQLKGPSSSMWLHSMAVVNLTYNSTYTLTHPGDTQSPQLTNQGCHNVLNSQGSHILQGPIKEWRSSRQNWRQSFITNIICNQQGLNPVLLEWEASS